MGDRRATNMQKMSLIFAEPLRLAKVATEQSSLA